VQLSRGHYFLVAALAVGLIAMFWFMAAEYAASGGQIAGYAGFGTLMVVLAIVNLRKGSTFSLGTRSLPHWLKSAFGAYALAFALWMLGSLLLLPFAGYAGFDLLGRPWFGPAILALTVLLLPITLRYMR
jgi:hypothetical protein